MATAHNEAKYEDINKRVLMPGDPKRAKYIADKYLTDVRVVNNVRNMTAYSGKYKGFDITIFPSGMGMASMSIYAYELFKFYDVEKVIRIGTAGANRSDIKLLDIILADSSYTLSNIMYLFDEYEKDEVMASSKLNQEIINTSKIYNTNVKEGRIICTDIFNPYVDSIDNYNSHYPSNLDSLASEMESFSLFYLAKKFNREATCLLTIVDSPFDERIVTSEDREKSLDDMIVLALDAIIK